MQRGRIWGRQNGFSEIDNFREFRRALRAEQGSQFTRYPCKEGTYARSFELGRGAIEEQR